MVVHHVLLLWSTLAMGVDAINVNHAEEKSVSGVCTTRDGYLTAAVIVDAANDFF